MISRVDLSEVPSPGCHSQYVLRMELALRPAVLGNNTISYPGCPLSITSLPFLAIPLLTLFHFRLRPNKTRRYELNVFVKSVYYRIVLT